MTQRGGQGKLDAMGLRFFPSCLCLLIFVVAASAAEKSPIAEGAKLMLAEQSAQVERELAHLIMQRGAALPAQRQMLEMQIDLRLVSRWMLKEARGLEGDAQAAGRLRAQLCLSTTLTLEDALSKQAGPFTAAQAAALGKLHELTFAVEKMKGLKDMDEASRRLGEVVIALALPAGTNEKSLLPVRPQPLAPSSGPAPSVETANAAELSGEVSRLNVSIPLRQQLIALAVAASQPPTGDSARDRETAAMLRELADAVELSRGLASNIGVSTQARAQIEAQLAEGLALFLDPRTRASGAKKLGELGAYRRMLTRIADLKLSAEQAAQFAPLFAWAREHTQQLDKVMSAVERYQLCRGRFARRMSTTRPAVHQSIGALERQFAAADRALLVAAGSLGKSPQESKAVFEVESQAEQMQRCIDLIEKLERMPVQLDFIGAFKVRNMGALERRMWANALIAAGPVDSTPRRDATKLIDDMDRLAQLARTMPRLTHAEIPQALDRRWTGGRLLDVQGYWTQTVSEIANVVAAGGPVDRKKLMRLPAAAGLYEALVQGVNMDMTLAGSAPVLAKWVDWRLGVEDLKPLLMAYPRAMAEAFAGFLRDEDGWKERWAKAQASFAPVIAEINRVGAYRSQCAMFPAGLPWLASALLTPMDNAPFATERYVAHAVWVWRWRRQAGQSAEADAVFEELIGRLGE